MNWFIQLWRFLISAHCFCGVTAKPPCRKHERRFLEGQGDDSCAYCRHAEPCHHLREDHL